jgi:oligoendopeptidase F
LEGKPNAREQYMQFLKAGSSLYPLDALKVAGVDLTAAEPVEEAYKILAELIDRLETLVG